jgi:PAS domain S-box-containing protein
MAQAETLMDQLAGHVKHGDHLCVVCDDPHERLAAAAQYIADGLRQNEFVMYAADPDTTGTLSRLLSEHGINVQGEIDRGALKFPTAYEAYLRDGEFDPEVIYNAFDQAITDALAAGFSGCRFAGEPIWAIDREDQRPGLIEFETRLNELFSKRKAAGLCVYERDAWPAEVVRDVLRTHPIAVVGNTICTRNLYYERPDLIDTSSSAETQVQWMLNQLQEVRTQESRFQIALEAGQLGSWELDLTTDTSVRSLRHDQIFGYEHLLPAWGYDSFIQHVLPEDRDSVNAAFTDAIANGTTWHFECRIRRKTDGVVRWIEAHGRPDPQGSCDDKVERLFGIVADITERKEMEQALRETDRRKDEFLATLAHELRNPLAPVLNALHLIQSNQLEADQANQMHSLIGRQVNHLVRLVDDLLDVSRITRGHIALQREWVDLRSVLTNAMEASQPVIEASGHTLSVSIPSEPLPLHADPTRLAQVFLNLLNNAAKYTPAGGQIELQVEREQGHVVVRVQDNGLGIAPEFLPSMFNMFVQGGRKGERAQGGLGVGLPLAKQLVELHGGSIGATSAGHGQGSEFLVRLPALAQDAHPSPPSPPKNRTTPLSVKSGHILVVDDNVDAADSLALTLQLLGHKVTTRYDGSSAVEAVEQLDPMVVVLDIGLPDMDGYEVARRLRSLKPNIILIALTGWGQEKDRQLALAAGFDLHRAKPVNPTEFLAVIQEKLSGPQLA